MKTSYDSIGKGYDTTRKADPYIAQLLHDGLDLPVGLEVLDVGCGTGNYTIALSERGLRLTGIDPSERMLDEARKKAGSVQWAQGVAEKLPFADRSFDGAIATLTTHHWSDMEAGFREIRRVLRPEAPLVIFTSTPEQMRNYWLWHYFPTMMERSAAVMPGKAHTIDALHDAGFSLVTTDPYWVKDDLQDLFLYSAKHTPAHYLDPVYRQGISSFTTLGDDQEIRAGLLRLEEDIASGNWHAVSNSFIDTSGDYLFIHTR